MCCTMLFFPPTDDKLILYTFTIGTEHIVTQAKKEFATWFIRKESFFPYVCMNIKPFQISMLQIMQRCSPLAFGVLSANFMELFQTIKKKENIILKDLKKHLNPIFPIPHPAPRDSFIIIRLIISKQRCCKTNQGQTK